MPARPSTAAKPCKYGHTSGRNKHGKCLECVQGWDLKFRQKHPNYQSNYLKNYRIDNWEKYLLWGARERAREGGYVCTITFDDIVIPEFCPLLGIKLQRGKGVGGQIFSSPSLDKIRPELGYVPGNVWVISQRANTLKNNASLEELQMLVQNLAVRMKKMPWECVRC